MSLLMDALKRAEEAKRQHHANATSEAASPAVPAAADIALEPLASEELGSGLPDLQSHQDALDKDLRDTADHGDLDLALTRSPPAATEGARHEARNVFAAKVPLVDESRQKKPVLLIIGIGCLAGVMIAGYFWYQLQAISGGSGLAGGITADARTSSPGPRSAGSLSSGGQPGAPLAAAPVTNEPAASSPVSPTGTAIRPAPSARAGAGRADRGPTQTSRRAAPARSGNAAAQPGDAPDRGLSFNVGKAAESTVMRAYAAWQAGNTDTARELYDNVLSSDGNHVDALLGLATIAARAGERQRAEVLFSRVLDVDPRNATAHAGLLALRGNADANQTESRLKTLLAQSNDQAANGTLNFALGNVYAEQQRWNEAQQAYFRAHVGDAENPDYAYNLAVSLDRLGQPTQARKYYTSALELAARRPSAFDRKLAEARLGQLAP